MRKPRWYIACFVVLILVAAGYHASQPVSTGAAGDAGVHGEVVGDRPRRATLRIATFNVHGCRGRDGRRDPGRTAECLGGFDFVALQEIDGPGWLGGADQAQQLGRHVGLAWLFAPAERAWGRLEFGNGLLSAVPVGWWQRIPLPRQRDASHRNAVLASIEHRGRTIRVLLTHLHQRDPDERRMQLETVIRLFLALQEPAILLGDLNSDAADPQIRQLLQTPGASDAVGEPLRRRAAVADLPGRVDWIIVRGLRCIDGGWIDDGASDHPLVWAELGFYDE